MKPSIETQVLSFIADFAVVVYKLATWNKVVSGNKFMQVYLAVYKKQSAMINVIQRDYDTFVELVNTCNCFYDTNDNYEQLVVPPLFIFWETESINRRVDKRHSKPKVKGLQITGKIDLRKWQGRVFTPLSISLDNNNFGWIERDYLLGSCTDEDRFYDIFSRIQLHYFKCARGHSRDKSMYTFDSIIWKMLLDDFYACTGNRNGIQIQSYYHHLLRQSMNELDCGRWYNKAGWAA